MVIIVNFKHGRQNYSLHNELIASQVLNILIISNKYILSIYFVSDTVLGPELHGAHTMARQTEDI